MAKVETALSRIFSQAPAVGSVMSDEDGRDAADIFADVMTDDPDEETADTASQSLLESNFAEQDGDSEAIAVGVSGSNTAEFEAVQSTLVELKHGRHDLSERLATVLCEELGEEAPIELDDVATDVVRDLIGSLERRQGQLLMSPMERDGESEPADTDTAPFDASGRHVVKLYDGEAHVATVSGRTQADAMVAAVNYFLEFRDLVAEISIPWIPGSKKAIINDSDEWGAADPVYKPVAKGLFLDTKLSKGGKKREIRRMGRLCGLRVEFGSHW